MTDNSSLKLKEKIKIIQNEKFDAKSKVQKSQILKKTIRNSGLQMVNHDIQCQSMTHNLWLIIIEYF